jgi:uncharacterized protein VirK/YbjX
LELNHIIVIKNENLWVKKTLLDREGDLKILLFINHVELYQVDFSFLHQKYRSVLIQGIFFGI